MSSKSFSRQSRPHEAELAARARNRGGRIIALAAIAMMLMLAAGVVARLFKPRDRRSASGSDAPLMVRTSARGRRARVFGAAALCAVAAIITVAVTGFALALHGDSMPAYEQDTTTFGSLKSVSMVFAMRQFDASSRALSGSLYIFAEPDGGQAINQVARPKTPFHCISDMVCVINRQYAHATLTVQVDAADFRLFPGAEIDERVPLAELGTLHQGYGAIVRSATVHLLGEPTAYPSDSYSATLVPMAILNIEHRSPVPYDVPVSIQWSRNLLSRVYDLSENGLCHRPDRRAPWLRVCSAVGTIVLSRPLLTQLYVYALSAVPAAVGTFLLLVAARNRRQRVHAGEFTVGLLAAVVAILPLRAVLVPADVPGLTRVDYLLALGLAIIVGAGLLHLTSSVGVASPQTS